MTSGSLTPRHLRLPVDTPWHAAVPWLLVAAMSFVLLPPAAAVRSVCVAPWCEEMVWRWGVQDALARRLDAAHLAWAPLLSALAFGLAHVLVAHVLLAPDAADLPRAAATVLPAWWIGLVYQRTRRIAPCAAWHAGFNLLWLTGLQALPGAWPSA